MIIKCKCGYEWNYKGKLLYVCCPSCRKLTKRTLKLEDMGISFPALQEAIDNNVEKQRF